VPLDDGADRIWKGDAYAIDSVKLCCIHPGKILADELTVVGISIGNLGERARRTAKPYGRKSSRANVR